MTVGLGEEHAPIGQIDDVDHPMQGSTSRMSRLIDNVLDFARGRLGGGIDIRRDAHEPLGPTLQLVIREMKSSAPERDVATEIGLDVPIYVDHSRIGQWFSNVLGNAVTHGDPEGSILVTAKVVVGHFVLSVPNRGESILPEASEHRSRSTSAWSSDFIVPL